MDHRVENATFFFVVVIKKLLHILLDLMTHQLQMLQSRSIDNRTKFAIHRRHHEDENETKTHGKGGRGKKTLHRAQQQQQAASAQHIDHLPAPTKESSASL